jgi:hypothetical protein
VNQRLRVQKDRRRNHIVSVLATSFRIVRL